jgi:predicted RNA-binding protein Jag
MSEAQNLQEVVRELIQSLFSSLGVEQVEVSMFSGREGIREAFVASISVPKSDSKILIGQHGVGLSSIQHLLQTMAKQKAGDRYESFSIDINHYWKDKYRHLRRDAEEAAHEVVSTGRPVQMRPMFSYERKIVETESSGHGEERRVTVKPASLL